MLAVIEQTEVGYTARMERSWKHSVQKVWSMLTDNDMLAKWFVELQVEELAVGGLIKFDMQNGTFVEMRITDLTLHSVLEYTWGEDQVRFELYPEQEGCRLVFQEMIHRLTDHTSRDLAGWHVCLDVISALLDDRTLESRQSEWNRLHPQYVQLIEPLKERG